MYFVYIIKSLKTERYYIGSTNNLERRIYEHNIGKMRSTKAYIPYTLVYKEAFSDRMDAVRKERYIKSQKSRSFIESLIKGE